MFAVITASSDTYITDKFIGTERAVSGNVGLAGTLDLFKLWDESNVVTGTSELTRVLLGFDWGRLQEITSSTLDINDFRAYLKMKSVIGGQPAPTDFTLSLFPLSSSFREGIGRDVSTFSHIDAANFISNSIGVLWNAEGANAGGLLGSSDIDYIASGNFGDGLGLRSFEVTQNFIDGNEDLVMDITDFVSASMVGLLPYPNFRLSFTGSQETDAVTYFVKRFGSRNAKNSLLRPRIEVYWDDSRFDSREIAKFNVSGTLYIRNTVFGERTNLVSGSSLTPITGSNCLLVRFTTGSYSKYFTGSQDSQSGFIGGIYSAPYIFASSDSGAITGSFTLSDALQASGSITFEEVWTSLDETVVFKSGTFEVTSLEPSEDIFGNDRVRMTCSGPSTAPPNTLVLVRCKFFDLALEDYSSKFSIERKPIPVTGLYRVIDTQSKEVYIDFNLTGNWLSADRNGNYFEFYSDSIPYGRPVHFEFKVNYNGKSRIISDEGYTFTLGS
jgi:hypothetical protein